MPWSERISENPHWHIGGDFDFASGQIHRLNQNVIGKLDEGIYGKETTQKCVCTPEKCNRNKNEKGKEFKGTAIIGRSHDPCSKKEWQRTGQQVVEGSRWCIFNEVEEESPFFFLPVLSRDVNSSTWYEEINFIYLLFSLQYLFIRLAQVYGAFFHSWQWSHFCGQVKRLTLQQCSQGFAASCLWTSSQ